MPDPQEYADTVSSIPVALNPLLASHVDEVEGRLAPGAAFVTWRALNVDGFVQNAQQVSSYCV